MHYVKALYNCVSFQRQQLFNLIKKVNGKHGLRCPLDIFLNVIQKSIVLRTNTVFTVFNVSLAQFIVKQMHFIVLMKTQRNVFRLHIFVMTHCMKNICDSCIVFIVFHVCLVLQFEFPLSLVIKQNMAQDYEKQIKMKREWMMCEL